MSNDVEALQRELEQTRQAFQNFAYVVSHDLSAPIRAVTNFTKLYKDRFGDGLDEKAAQYLHFIENGGIELQEHMAALLELSRLFTHEQSPEPINIGLLAREIGDLYDERIIESKAKVNYDCDVDINIDKQLFVKILNETIDNALRFHEEGARPEVDVVAKEKGGEVVITISDNGIGVPEDKYEHVLTIFRKLHTKEEYSGIGKGLAIAQTAAEQLGGSLVLSPSKAGGLCVTVTLPKG